MTPPYSHWLLRTLTGAVLGTLACSSWALDGDRVQLKASTSVLYDDNLTRSASSSGQPILTDEITTVQAGAEIHLAESRQNYDGNIYVVRGLYAHKGSQDYTGVNYLLGAATDVGNEAHIALNLTQTQALQGLQNIQALVRDLVTTRTGNLTMTDAIGPRYSIETGVSVAQQRNDAASLNYNDNNSLIANLGVSYAIADASKIGIRGIYNRTSFLNPSPALAPLTTPYDPSFIDRRVEIFGSLDLTPVTKFNGSVAEGQRTYGALNGSSVSSVYGLLAVEHDSGTPLSYGGKLRREIGGVGVLASSVADTDGLEVHGKYSYSELLSFNASTEVRRVRYTVSSPGLDPHVEYGDTILLGAHYIAARWVTFDLTAGGDWRRSNQSIYSFVDHRYMLTANFLI